MMAKKPAPTRRGGLSAIAHGLKSAAAMHRMEKTEAEKNFPILKQKLDDIKERFKENRAAGRYDYRRSLLEIYSLVWKWHQEGKLNDGRLATIPNSAGSRCATMRTGSVALLLLLRSRRAYQEGT
jgi:hypothetical protein